MGDKQTLKVIGLMSGTSCDSIDACLCEVNPDLSCTFIKGINYVYPPHISSMLFQSFRGNSDIKDLCRLNFLVGECFAEAANILIEEFGKPDLISSHGQTIYHYPYDRKTDGFSEKSTLQIGEGAVIAERTGVLTISDFRTRDIAAGGQGAPLVCFADEKWFKNALVQNIGGISNVTVVSDNLPTFGFDTGCGNLMIDYCMKKLFGQPYDKDGEIALSGQVSESWLDCLLQDEYYFAPPPKTTGREYFNENYIENILKIAPKEDADIIATLTALTAKSIVQAYERFVFPLTAPQSVIVGGGGAYNKAIMKFLKRYLPENIELKTHEDFGLSNNFKEAMAFALLGYCAFYGIPNNLPECTGAGKRVVMGKFNY